VAVYDGGAAQQAGGVRQEHDMSGIVLLLLPLLEVVQEAKRGICISIHHSCSTTGK